MTPADSAAHSPPLASYCVGVVHYHAYPDLAACLASLADQSHAPTGVWVIDADGDPGQFAQLVAEHPDIRFHSAPNLGYAGAANRLLARIADEAPGTDFVLLLNPDITLEPEFGRILVDALSAHPSAAVATGKLMRPDGVTLDSAGIALPAHRRPRDRGSEAPDRGQFDRGEYVFGASGAAMLLRRSALADLAIEGEIFDEDFFLYHEDTDLCWRCRGLGWRVYYEPRARAIHRRGWRKEGRMRVPVSVRRHSFKNHYLQLIKNESLVSFLLRLPLLVAWEILRLGHAVLRDRGVLAGYGDALRLAPRAFRKRRELRRGAARRRARSGGR